MGVKFKSTHKKNLKEFFKSSIPFVALGAAFIAILSLLIFPERIASANERDKVCENLGLHGGGGLFSSHCNRNFDKIIFIVGDTANTPVPSVNYPDYIKYAYRQDAPDAAIYAMSVANPSRKPKQIATKTEGIESVAEYIENMSAKQDGADYLEAIRTAANLASAGNKERALIYIIGSGLSDTGILNFADDNLLSDNKNTDMIVNSASKVIDDYDLFSAMTIVWQGVGEVVEPQLDLPSYANEKLKDIYEGLFKELSEEVPTIIFKEGNPISDKSSATTYHVKETPVSAQVTSFNKTYADTFGFVDGRDYLIDEPAALNEINAIIKQYMQSSRSDVTITVHVSRGENCFTTPDNDLIQRRLDRISGYFVERGISRSRIHLKNGGFGPEEDCKNGQFLGNEIASKNRIVIIEVKE